MRKILLLLAFLAVSVCFGDDVKFYDPSFSCSKVKEGSIDYRICTDDTLSKLDKKLSNIYKSFPFISKEIKSDQRAWMKQRNQCQETNCIKEAYTTRLEELTTSLANQKTFPKLYLDAMKEAQKTMEIVWDPIIFSKKKYIEAGLQFEEELFRFKNIYYKKPLIENVQYDNPKLKEILGACSKYKFYLSIGKHRNIDAGDNQKYFIWERQDTLQKKLNFSIWKVNAKGKEQFFIKPADSDTFAYLVETNLCKQMHLDNDLIDALNNDKVKMPQNPFSGYPMIVNYKDKEYVFEMFLIDNHSIRFSLYEVLGIKSFEDKTIRVAGTLLATIPFKIIKKSQKEGK